MQLVDEIQKGILCWYPWKAGSSCLLVGNDTEALEETLLSKEIVVDRQSLEEVVGVNSEAVEKHINNQEKKYDYIVAIRILEYCKDPSKTLALWKAKLKKEGLLFLGVENRLGLRYFCGDRDPFTGCNFDGLEHYRRYGSESMFSKGGRCFSQREIKNLISESGLVEKQMYSVFPDLKAPQLIYNTSFLPNEDLSIRYFPVYNYSASVFLQEEYLFKDLIQNGLFHLMANANIYVCAMREYQTVEEDGEIQHVTLSFDRGPEKALSTVILKESVKKIALYPKGQQHLVQLYSNMKDLKQKGVPIVNPEMENGIFIMPYIDAPLAQVYLREIILENKEEFVEKLDLFRELILKSSGHVKPLKGQEGLGIILERGYMDMVPLNAFYMDDTFYFFDQEYYISNCPANAIIYRMLIIVYNGDKNMENILPMSFFMERYKLQEMQPVWWKYTSSFIQQLRNKSEWEKFRVKYQRMDTIVMNNRENINDTDYYEKLRYNCFLNSKNKKIYIFGTGKFADKFFAMYRYDCEIIGVIDNNQDKWGTIWNGFEVCSPEILTQVDLTHAEVVVCIKQFQDVVHQLLAMNVPCIGIYDAHYLYPGRQVEIPKEILEKKEEKKKYHIGYIAGVFDLYHIGHLNMFRRAKEQCDYLIVGVVSDEGVRQNKKKEPFIPFDERIELVRSCRYVDEAVEIPFVYCRTPDAFEKYHFDVQFSGSDYENDAGWLAMKDYLEQRGSTMVFFPYTERTSSTKIKELIERKLI